MTKWTDNFEDVLSKIKEDLKENMNKEESSFIHKGKKVIVERRTINGNEHIEKAEKQSKQKNKQSKKDKKLNKKGKSLSKLKKKKQIVVRSVPKGKLNYSIFPDNNMNREITYAVNIDYSETAKQIEEFNKEFEQYNKIDVKLESPLQNQAEIIFDGLQNKVYQKSKTSNNDDEIVLCIGLDVGSSTTKVVIKEAYLDDAAFYLVDFGSRGICGQEYLLPTYISYVGNNYFIPKYGDNPTYTNLKVNYMNGYNQYEELLELYIAFVIKYTISWFIEKHGEDDIVKNKNIIWNVNLGIPSAQFNAHGKNKKYWELLKNACNLIKEENEEFESFNIVPEIIASIQSFVKRNDISHEGLYCVSDVGAGTLDICTFRVSKNEDDFVYSFYKSSVEKLGVHELQKCCKSFEPLKRVYEYRNRVLASYQKVIYPTYKRRDPYTREWKEKLPIASIGGGNSLSFYKNIIKQDLTKWIKNNCIDLQTSHDCQGFSELNIKYNINNIITAIKNIDCSRLNVALGLSYNISTYSDIKKYYKECEIEDIKKYRHINIEDNYTGKEQV